MIPGHQRSAQLYSMRFSHTKKGKVLGLVPCAVVMA